ncbi:protein bunched, class 1/class 3/D/E isoforms-like isoform X4 [Thrips palmi]|uniref:Protein bunched, class 1/class 3/D/E isoforms-like isoform X4 n=1 Tax=Thrips palmi TaxID=161013 RepID=A0A6P8ZST0_THRPL|nr:protein bunched, class 1/class 3/D/E isoforms-like isoform X4 [Thrips palmi]
MSAMGRGARSRSLSHHGVLSPAPTHVLVRRGTWANASGASAVAIDNKIEQAMDLVKSHLMFAVREEVEVLKDKIAELMDRINQLELENSILKAHATQETLEQLVAGKAVMDVPPAAAPEQQNGIATP